MIQLSTSIIVVMKANANVLNLSFYFFVCFKRNIFSNLRWFIPFSKHLQIMFKSIKNNLRAFYILLILILIVQLKHSIILKDILRSIISYFN